MKYSGQDSAMAWVVCFAGCFNLFIMGGFSLATGIFYIMFKEAIDAADSEIAFAVSLNPALIHFVGPFAGRLCQAWGCRTVSMVGSILSVVGIACSAFATSVIHLYLSYGLIAGIGIGMMVNSGAAVITPYFDKYRRLAASFVWSGSALGSLVFAPIIKLFSDVYGWRGALLLLAGVNAQALVTSALLRPFKAEDRDRKQNIQQTINGSSGQRSEKEGGIIANNQEALIYKSLDIARSSSYEKLSKRTMGQSEKRRSAWKREFDDFVSLFKIAPFVSVNLCTFIGTFPIAIVLTHFGNYGVTCGFTPEDVVRMYMLFGISSTISRPLSGILSQVLQMNLTLLMMVTLMLDGVITFIVASVSSLWLMYAYTVLFKLFLGPYNALGAAVILEHVPPRLTPTAFGLYTLTTVPAYFTAAPTAAWLYNYTNVYEYSFYVGGALLLLSGLVLAPVSCHAYKRARHSERPAKDMGL